MWNWIKKYPYSLTFVFSITLTIILYWQGVIDWVVFALGPLGYLGAFFAGMFFSTSFGGPAGTLFLFDLGGILNPYLIALIGGLGAMCTDLLIYRLIKDSLFQEIKIGLAFILSPQNRERLELMSRKRFFLWGVPFLASFFIASPLPDEIGVSLFSLINFKPKYLSLITFTLNTLGIFTIVMLGHYTLNLN